MNTPDFFYKAFISYSGENKMQRKWLSEKLSGLDFQKCEAGLCAKYKEQVNIGKFFIDTDHEASEESWTETIHNGLKQSEFLIVICTPEAARSRWVREEICYFKKIHEARFIIPCVFDGVPSFPGTKSEWHGKSSGQCFPLELLFKVDKENGNVIDEREADPKWYDFRKENWEEKGNYSITAGKK